MTERAPDEPDDPKPEDEEDQNLELGRIAAEIEQAAAEHRRYHAIDYHIPYPKQWEFHHRHRPPRARRILRHANGQDRNPLL